MPVTKNVTTIEISIAIDGVAVDLSPHIRKLLEGEVKRRGKLLKERDEPRSG